MYIHEVLNISQYDYDYVVMQMYHDFCALRSATDKELQALLSSKSLFKWFRRELDILELVWFDQTGISKENKVILYNKTVATILEYHPPSRFINEIKKAGLPVVINEINFN